MASLGPANPSPCVRLLFLLLRDCSRWPRPGGFEGWPLALHKGSWACVSGHALCGPVLVIHRAHLHRREPQGGSPTGCGPVSSWGGAAPRRVRPWDPSRLPSVCRRRSCCATQASVRKELRPLLGARLVLPAFAQVCFDPPAAHSSVGPPVAVFSR